MVKVLPHNFKRMTASQRAMCGCEVCLDGASLMNGLMVWRSKHWKELVAIVEQLTDQGDCPELASMKVQLKNWEQAVFVHEDGSLLMDKLNNPKHQHETIEQWVAANTCQKVKCGDGELYHFNCVIGRCVHCDAQSLPPTEEIGFHADNDLLVDEDEDEIHHKGSFNWRTDRCLSLTWSWSTPKSMKILTRVISCCSTCTRMFTVAVFMVTFHHVRRQKANAEAALL